MKKSKAKITTNIKIGKIKYNSVNARANYQIPLGLYELISALNSECSLEQVEYLVNSSYHYFRVKGYYKKFPKLDDEYSLIIKEEYQKIF